MSKEKLLKCMGTCWHWEQVFYQDDYEAEYEKCYQHCNSKKHEVKEKDCINCEQYKCRYTVEEIARM